jgi:hypothetical protein
MARAGQTKPPVMPRLSDRIAIGVLTRTFPPELVDRVITQTGSGRAASAAAARPRGGLLHPCDVPVAQVGYEEVMRPLVEGLAWARRWQVPDKSSIARARARLGPAPLRALFVEVARPLATRKTKGAWYRGWRLVALDGTTLDVPDTPANVAAAGRGRSRRCAWWGWWSAAPMRSWTRPWVGCTWPRRQFDAQGLKPGMKVKLILTK